MTFSRQKPAIEPALPDRVSLRLLCVLGEKSFVPPPVIPYTVRSSLLQPDPTPRQNTRFLPILLLLFAGSGCSALIYEVAWYQFLQLAIGSTSVSLGILLATFMGGLCIGSIWFPRLRLSGSHPLRVYGAIELGIGILGVIVTAAMPFIGYVYVAGAASGMPGMLLRGIVAAVAMLPSTILMGASLPAIARWIEATPRGVARWALLYGANTAGAVFGCLLAGFWLLRVFDMATAAWTAAAINLAVAGASWLLARSAPVETPSSPAIESAPTISASLWTVYVSTALSGACAMGAEVIWTRLLSMLLLGTVYVFSIILAVFLTGLAVGGAVASWIIRAVRPRLALGWSQLLLVLGILWTAWMITGILPNWVDSVTTTNDPWTMFYLDLKRCIWAILPPSLLWGAAFPLACAAAVSSSDEDPARVTGGVYAANTLGAIIGALGVSLILIPAIGTQQATRVILVLSALSGLVVLWPIARQSAARAALAVAMVLSIGLAVAIPATPGELIAYGRRMAENTGQSKILKVVEGINSSVAISRWDNDTIYINVNGHVEATTEIFDMKLQRMVGHLPALLHPNPKSVLGIGFGAGVSAGTFTRYPGIEHITICEIEPAIPPTSTEYFGKQDYEVFHNPKTHVVFDDARHYLLTTNDKFDVIASDPLDVFVKGTAALYSKEYFESVKRHLNPGGYFSLYVPLYETDLPTIRSELETFFDAFPNATIWANTRDGLGYDMVFMGQVEPLKINVDEIQTRLDRPDYAPVKESLAGVGIYSAEHLFSTYTGQKRDVGRWTQGAEINRDANLRLSYLAGWGINAHLDDFLYREMLSYRQEPDNIFTGSPEKVESIWKVIQQASR
jgi:spermidine synthase